MAAPRARFRRKRGRPAARGLNQAPRRLTSSTSEPRSSSSFCAESPGVQGRKTPVIEAGNSAELDVDLRAGEYTLYCSVPGHRDAGMETTIDIK